MAGVTPSSVVELARGGGPREEAIREFWERHGGPRAEAADARLPEVVCVALGEGERVVGVSSAFAAEVPLVNRRLWVCRRLVAPGPGAEETRAALVSRTYAALDAEFAAGGQGPLGLCLLLGDPEEIAARPELQWADPRMLYMGYLQDGRQLRVAWFTDARIGPGPGDG